MNRSIILKLSIKVENDEEMNAKMSAFSNYIRAFDEGISLTGVEFPNYSVEQSRKSDGNTSSMPDEAIFREDGFRPVQSSGENTRIKTDGLAKTRDKSDPTRRVPDANSSDVQESYHGDGIGKNSELGEFKLGKERKFLDPSMKEVE